MAVLTGLEPAISSVTDWHVNHYTTGPWLRGKDLNQRPSGYEPDELPDCSTPRCRCACNIVTGTTIQILGLYTRLFASSGFRQQNNNNNKLFVCQWRRKRDSNPRDACTPCRFSRPIPSARLGYSSGCDGGPGRTRTCDRPVMSREL